MADRLSAEQWSTYWKRGTITTFLGRFAANYEGGVAQFWQTQFERCPADARIVDLAAGNGALALLAARFADTHESNFAISAIDYADVNPSTLEGLDEPTRRLMSRIDFRANTPVEDTGLAAASFDLAVSQFGFEYADPGAAVAELDRVLKPTDAGFAALIHHSESAIVEQAKDGIRQGRLCVKSGITETARALVDRLAELRRKRREPQSDPTAEGLREQLNKQTGQLDAMQKKFRDPSQIAFYLRGCMEPFNTNNRGLDHAQRVHFIQIAKTETEQYVERMEDLINVAAQHKRIDLITQRLRQKGFNEVTHERFEFEGVLFAHALVARR